MCWSKLIQTRERTERLDEGGLGRSSRAQGGGCESAGVPGGRDSCKLPASIQAPRGPEDMVPALGDGLAEEGELLARALGTQQKGAGPGVGLASQHGHITGASGPKWMLPGV